MKDLIDFFGGNGLKFAVNGDSRPRIQDLDDCVRVYTDENSFVINKSDMDDLLVLFQHAKHTGYDIKG
jgi:hypothetical protein